MRLVFKGGQLTVGPMKRRLAWRSPLGQKFFPLAAEQRSPADVQVGGCGSSTLLVEAESSWEASWSGGKLNDGSADVEGQAIMDNITRMLARHAQGLRRVAKVIQDVDNYDDLMGHKLTSAEIDQFGVDVAIAEKRARAVSRTRQQVLNHSFKVILPEFGGFVCDGNTLNNLREFEFFERICSPLELKILAKNYAHLPRISAGKRTDEQESALKQIVADLEEFYSETHEISASLVHQQILYSRSFFSFLLSFTAPGAIRPAALVTANDHSPVRVALFMVLKAMGVPTIYLQHAEVTQSFPPLDFEYSVLRNKRALKVYEGIGPCPGKVFIIPRYDQPFDRDSLTRRREKPLAVVIYPSSRVRVKPLEELVCSLKDNPGVSKIIIKEHPGAVGHLHGLPAFADLEFSALFPQEDHLAIVGNSSVAVELLHRGIPVYQNFDFDPVAPDYYGLIKSGITREISKHELSQCFWSKPHDVSGRWLEAYAEWDPTATRDHLADQAEFLAAMEKLKAVAALERRPRGRRMNGRLRARAKGSLKRGLIKFANAHPEFLTPAMSKLLMLSKRLSDRIAINTDRVARFLAANTQVQINAPVWRQSGARSRSATPLLNQDLLEFLLATLVQVDDPAAWLVRNERVRAVAASALIATLEMAFQRRDPSLNHIFAGIPSWSPGSAVLAWTYLKKIEWGNLQLSEDQIEPIADSIYAYDFDLGARNRLEEALFAAILRSGTCEQLDRFWQNATCLHRSGLSVQRKLQVLRKLRTDPTRASAADELLEEIEEKATGFELLKLENFDFLAGKVTMDWDHLRAEKQFSKLAPNVISREFETLVKPTYDNLRRRMSFMKLRCDAGESSRLMSMIELALRAKHAFSLIRLSDGEGYFFPEGSIFTEEDIANRERHWWGNELPAAIREDIIGQARAAVAEADVVGIPAIYRFIRDNGEGSASLAQSVQGRGLLEVLSGVPSAVSDAALITEDKANVALFGRAEALSSLLDLAERVIVVSSVVREALPAILKRQSNLRTIAIPTHHKTALNEMYHSGPQPLPLVYGPIVDDLDAMVRPGDLVLVAGGVVGKIFVGRCRAKGAVALDLGHVIDDWITPNLASVR